VSEKTSERESEKAKKRVSDYLTNDYLTTHAQRKAPGWLAGGFFATKLIRQN